MEKNCLICKKSFTVSPSRITRRYCSNPCRNESNRGNKYAAAWDHSRIAKSADRFWDYVEKTDTCWNWTKGKSSGYGRFSLHKHEFYYAHRYSYEQLIGKIPDGKVIDHLCENKACVNPDHMQVVTRRANSKRGQCIYWHNQPCVCWTT